MSKLSKFKKQVEKARIARAKLNEEGLSLSYDLSEKNRLISDLMLQGLMEDSTANIDKEIATLKKDAEKLKAKLADTHAKLEVLDGNAAAHLQSYREDAYAEHVKNDAQNKLAYEMKLKDIKKIRAVLLEELAKLGDIYRESQRNTSDFINDSRAVDGRYENMKAAVPFPNINGMANNYAGDHAPVLPLEHEMRAAVNGVMPSWFAHYQLTGEILSAAEIAAKGRK